MIAFSVIYDDNIFSLLSFLAECCICIEKLGCCPDMLPVCGLFVISLSSVMRVYCDKTTEDRITWFSLKSK